MPARNTLVAGTTTPTLRARMHSVTETDGRTDDYTV